MKPQITMVPVTDILPGDYLVKVGDFRCVSLVEVLSVVEDSERVYVNGGHPFEGTSWLKKRLGAWSGLPISVCVSVLRLV